MQEFEIKDIKGWQAKNNTAPARKKENRTGIPDATKSGFEGISGFAFDDVRVHYNSQRPAAVQALAYTQGNNVYIGPGQEKYLHHELGHVVQQKQGKVKPTGYVAGFPVNDKKQLETEADNIGRKAKAYNS